MYVSPTKAVKMYQVSKPTLYEDMKSGKLSYEINDRKKRKINVAELDRLYEKRTVGQGASQSKSVKQNPSLTVSNDSERQLEKELAEIREKLGESQNQQIKALQEQIAQQQDHIERLNQSLNKALDITALLEDKREGQGAKESERESKMAKLEARLEQLTADTERQAVQNKKHRRRIAELEQEKAKGFFERLFG